MQVRRPISVGRPPKRADRSMTGTTAPRRLITPRMKAGIIGISVRLPYSMISLTLRMATAIHLAGQREGEVLLRVSPAAPVAAGCLDARLLDELAHDVSFRTARNRFAAAAASALAGALVAGAGAFGARAALRPASCRRGRRLRPSTRKNGISCCSCSAWPPISSAVAASSSEAEAFCCVAWFNWPMAPLIWPTPADLLRRGGGDLLHQVGGLAGWRAPSRRAACRPSRPASTRGAGQLADLLGGDLAALGQLAHFGRHHGEALAVLAGAGRLDGGIERQQVGLVGDVVDDADLAGDLLHGLDGLLDRLRRRRRPPGRPWWPCRR